MQTHLGLVIHRARGAHHGTCHEQSLSRQHDGLGASSLASPPATRRGGIGLCDRHRPSGTAAQRHSTAPARRSAGSVKATLLGSTLLGLARRALGLASPARRRGPDAAGRPAAALLFCFFSGEGGRHGLANGQRARHGIASRSRGGFEFALEAATKQ